MALTSDESRVPVAAATLVGVSTDVVVFAVRDEELAVLLLRRTQEPFAGFWALPGGVLGGEETPDDGAERVLREKTAMSGVFLEQLYTFGQPQRDPRGRIVTIGYFALLPWCRAAAIGQKDGALRWQAATDLPPLAFDHAQIVAMAWERLAAKLAYTTIALQLMPPRFTLSELQSVYEVILGEALDKRNFRKRVRSFDCIEHTGEFHRAGNHRPARLYRIKSPGAVQIIK